MDGFHWAGLLTGTAADALWMIGIFYRIYLHLAGFGTSAAMYAFLFIQPITEDGNRVEYGVNCA